MRESLNKTLLKKFAIESRNELREKIALKASVYGITKELSDKDRKTKGLEGFANNDDVVITTNEGNRILSNAERSQRTALIEKIQRINKEDRDGFNEVIEEVAYTWFNRFIALRYMEVNGYLPSRIKILASSDNTNTPEVLTEAMNVSLPIDKNLVYELKKDNKNEELYKYLVELQCSELNKPLPFMFEKIGHFAELLFPAGIITSKFFRTLVDTESITEDAWSNVEIIGWLYQYYISEEKDRVIKAKNKYKKNEIPFATQLFTPDWIVRYMVQNSLGRYWVESHEEDSDLKENWEFYLENPEKEADFDKKIAPYINKELSVEDIKCFDPACGSGHILVYMFDVLHEIYSKCGYSRGEIPMLIIEKNLYGLDIDMRAYQLACFAVIMKGMSYDKLLLRKIGREVDSRDKYIDLNIACVKETNILFEDENTTLHDNIAFLAKEQSGKIYDKVKLFVESLKNANTFGSLTKVEGFDKEFLENRLDEIKNNPATDIFSNKSSELWMNILEDLIKQSSIMEKTYDVLVTNPPYMGSNYMNTTLSTFIKTEYPNVKGDMFSSFMIYCLKKVKLVGQLGFVTPFVWLYIKTYEELREVILTKSDITTLIQLEYNAFPEACVPVCTFTIRRARVDLCGVYISLEAFNGVDIQSKKVLEAKNLEVNYKFYKTNSIFIEMPEKEIIFSVNKNISDCFTQNKKISEFAECKSGIMTGKDSLFIKKWYEVKYNNIKFDCNNIDEMKGYRWFPVTTGGEFRKYYGNTDYVINLYNNGSDIRSTSKNYRLRDSKYYFQKAITWSRISSSKVSFRVANKGSVFGDAGPCLYVNEDDYYWLLGFLNSNVCNRFLKALNPTMNFQIGDVKNIPIRDISEDEKKEITNIVIENLELYKNDWDEVEISADFKFNKRYFNGHKKLKEFLYEKNNEKNEVIKKIIENEEKINKIFIESYKLSKVLNYQIDELSIERKSELENIQILLSSFIGCLFGRYSLDQEGLVCVSSNYDIDKYKSFIPSQDNIILLSNEDSKYFSMDIISKLEEFLSAIFTEEFLDDNIQFIANVLNEKSEKNSKDVIREYFVKKFFNEHCNMYENKPIYWLFTSGKNKAFNCLVYQNRIDKNLLSKMRIDYVQPLQNKLDIEFKDLIDTMNSDAPAKDKKDAKKKLTLVEKQIVELKVYQEKLKHMADKQIELDLDNGVIHNRGLFGDLLAKIK